MFSCPIRVHSWFKHCLDYVFAYSCPFVSIRGSPSSPSFVFFRVFRVFRGSNTAWTTFFAYSCPFVSIRGSSQYLDYVRVHSCPFVVLPLHPPSCFFVFFVFFVLFVLFVVLPLHPSSCFSCFSWFKHCLDHVFLHIRVHSCPFVVLHLPPPSCFSWFKHCLDYVFLHIRVHS